MKDGKIYQKKQEKIFLKYLTEINIIDIYNAIGGKLIKKFSLKLNWSLFSIEMVKEITKNLPFVREFKDYIDFYEISFLINKFDDSDFIKEFEDRLEMWNYDFTNVWIINL